MPIPTRGEASPQPHDALFQWTFSQRRHAAGLLKAALPSPVAGAMDFRTLRVKRTSFVSPALRRRHSDLVVSVRLRGRRDHVYALIEHQRRVQRLMMLRKNSYMAQLWERLVRDNPALRGIPPIFPLLVHHSKAGWTAATTFQEIVSAPPELQRAMAPFVPHFQMKVVDLSEGKQSHLDEQALTALGKVVLWCLSVAWDDARLDREIATIGAPLAEVIQDPDATGAVEAILRYLLATHRQLDVAKASKLLEIAAGPDMREIIVTELDEIERRGVRRGVRETLLRQMDARFGAVPEAVAARVEAADKATLNRWSLRVLTAATPEEVISDAGRQTARRPVAARKPATPARSARTAKNTRRRA